MGKIRLLGQHILQFLTCCTDITFSHTVYQQNLIQGDFHTCHLRTKYRHQKGNLHAFFLLQLHRTVHSKGGIFMGYRQLHFGGKAGRFSGQRT